MEEHELQASAETPARFQFRLRTLMFVVFLVSLYFSAVATLGNFVLGCVMGVPIGLVIGAIVGRVRRDLWRGISGGVAGTLFVNGLFALLTIGLALATDNLESADPPLRFLIIPFSISSLAGAIPGAIVGVRVHGEIRTSVNTGGLALPGTWMILGLIFVVATEIEDALLAPPAVVVAHHSGMRWIFLFCLTMMTITIGPLIGGAFGALYWLLEERVRQRQEQGEQRSDASQSRSDLSADDHSPDERHDSHE